jgi:DNA gyrase/topoisomerase IV subunit A
MMAGFLLTICCANVQFRHNFIILQNLETGEYVEDEILVIANGGVVIRTQSREISSQGRDATGVRVMNLTDGQSVAAVAPVLASDD